MLFQVELEAADMQDASLLKELEECGFVDEKKEELEQKERERKKKEQQRVIEDLKERIAQAKLEALSFKRAGNMKQAIDAMKRVLNCACNLHRARHHSGVIDRFICCHFFLCSRL